MNAETAGHAELLGSANSAIAAFIVDYPNICFAIVCSCRLDVPS